MEGSAAELLMEESAVELVHRVQQYVENTPDVADHATDWPRLVEAWSSLRKACSSAERSLRRASWPKAAPPCFRHRCSRSAALRVAGLLAVAA